MTLPRDVAMDLMALADGELEGEARERAAELLRGSAEAQQFFRGMNEAHAGAAFEKHMAAKAAACDVDGIADTVIASIRYESPKLSSKPLAPGANSLPGKARTRLRTAAQLTALALAAGVVLYGIRRPRVDEDLATRLNLAPPGTSSIMTEPSPASEGVEVDEIDSPSHDVSVFEIGGTAAAAAAMPTHSSSVVIWVDEPESK